MTIEELRLKFDEMIDDEFQEFQEKFGGGQKSREERVKEFARNPEHERLICYMLGLKTEDEKLTKAALKSAKAASASAKVAFISCIGSVIAALIALRALI